MIRRARSLLVLLGLLPVVPWGCSTSSGPTTRPSSWYEQARRDPMGYSPKLDRVDISGGDIGHLDKDALKRDVDHVLNP